MNFYHYRQNNSGGAFDIDEESGISINVIIEAESTEDADERAEEIGLYFNGCDTGQDCSCCGDRWHSAALLSDKGDPVPSIYGESVATWAPTDMHIDWSGQSPPTFIHYSDGTTIASPKG